MSLFHLIYISLPEKKRTSKILLRDIILFFFNMEITKALLILGLFSAYCLAGCLMEHFTIFHSWTLITRDFDLLNVQWQVGMRTFYVYIIPKVIITLMPIPLVREQPLLWWALANMAISWISSFLVQIPLQLKVRENKEKADRVALQKLVRSTWVRTITMVGHCAVVFYVIWIH